MDLVVAVLATPFHRAYGSLGQANSSPWGHFYFPFFVVVEEITCSINREGIGAQI